ncbi:MAG: hypothetical protein HY914_23110 [Desulfomonile tiedjei]|nr:hypothetical protein [Desulfomonile tiedjei]
MMGKRRAFRPLIALGCCAALLAVGPVLSLAEGPAKAPQADRVRYPLPASAIDKPFRFADEPIPLQRPDVHYRILCHMNFLLMDARGVLTEWLSEKARYAWIFEELFAKEGLPKDLVLLAPVIASLNASPSPRGASAGWWALTSPCTAAEGVDMTQDSWHDDRLDLELSTRCFATRLKNIRKELGDQGWLMSVTAYVTSVKTVQDLRARWGTSVFWDLPLPDLAEDIVARWIALALIDANRQEYGLRFTPPPPLTFDQVSGLLLAKDLPVGEIAKFTGTPPREILGLNPKIKVSQPIFPARVGGKPFPHAVAAPKGKGQALVDNLTKQGYLAPPAKP